MIIFTSMIFSGLSQVWTLNVWCAPISKVFSNLIKSSHVAFTRMPNIYSKCNGRPWFVRWCPQEQLYLKLNVDDVVLQAPVDLDPFFSSWTKFVPKNAG